MEITGALLTVLLAYFFVTIAVSVELPAGLPAGYQTRISRRQIEKKPVPTREGRRRACEHRNRPGSYDPCVPRFRELGCEQPRFSEKTLQDIDLLIPEQLHAVSATAR